ncbi:MAG: hypothetical protein II221_04440 [Paludibacteraceae bacterium]|nr:hypothetical protein [Paludibacteraceae bacterium]
MGLLDKLQKKQADREEEVRNREEEYISLVRVYIQAVMASHLGINNINMIPELAMFKRRLKVQTLNGRLGEGERVAAKKMIKQVYKMDDDFFTELDKSIRRMCKKQQDIQSYFVSFQGMLNDLLMVLSSELQWKLRLPKIFNKMLKGSIQTAIADVFSKTNWSGADLFRASQNVHKYNEKFKFSQKWVYDFVYPVLMIAKGSKI